MCVEDERKFAGRLHCRTVSAAGRPGSGSPPPILNAWPVLKARCARAARDRCPAAPGQLRRSWRAETRRATSRVALPHPELVTGKRARTAPAADRVFEQARRNPLFVTSLNFPKPLALGRLSRPLASSTRTEVIPELLVVAPGRCSGYVFSGCVEDAPRLGRPRRGTRRCSVWWARLRGRRSWWVRDARSD